MVFRNHPGAIVVGRLGNVGFIELHVIDENAAILNADGIPGQANGPFNEVLFGVEGVMEDDHVAALDRSNAVGQAVDEQEFAGHQGGFHADVFHAHPCDDCVDGEIEYGSQDEHLE